MSNLNPNQRIYDVLLEIERGKYRNSRYPAGVRVGQGSCGKPAGFHPERVRVLRCARLYFQIDHIPSGVVGDVDYRFEFLTPSAATQRPNMVSLLEVVKLTPRDKAGYLDVLTNKLCAGVTGDAERSQLFRQKRGDIETNINVVQWAFIGQTALLIQEVDQRHDYDHVLEIFQRVNSGGMVLSKSDLMFSTLTLRIQGMEEKFAETLRFLNQGGRHFFNRDFLIKTCLVLFN